MTSWVRFSLKHPVPTIVFFMVAVVVGFVSLTRLSIDLLPAMEIPLAVVSTRYEGAGPQEVESLVSRPLEEIMGTVAGVTRVRSSNSEGQSLVIVEFDYGTNMDLATLAMREKVDQIRELLPDGVGSSNVFKIDPQALPVLTIGLTGQEDLNALKRLAEDQIKPRLERLNGVASVSVNGGTEREIQVIVDPGRLQAAGLSINQVAQALRYENLNLPGGEVAEGNVKLLVRTLGQFQSVDEIRNLRLGPVKLGDVAEVRDTYAEATSKVWLDGKPAVSLDIQKQAGGNAVAVANAVKAELKEIERELPGEVQAAVLSDQSRMIINSINSITEGGMQGGILAILVLLLFLRHFRATLAVAVAIPVSVITTFGPLFFGGVTLNIMSMGGLSLGVGMMVDGAIVVLENIFRHKEMGKDTSTAALEGTSEVALAVTASTLTSVVVFLPVVWITGLAQLYFRELALSVTFSLLVSVMVSLTVVPILATWLLRDRSGPARPPSRLYIKIGERLQALDALYGRVLNWALRRRWTVIGIGLSSLLVAGLLATQMGMEFVPSSDTSEFRVSIKMPPGTRLEETEKAVERAVEQIQGVPELQQTFVAVGGSPNSYVSTAGKSNEGYIVGMISRPTERSRSLNQVMEDVRSRILLPGARVSVTASGALDPGGAPIEVRLSGSDLAVLEDLGNRVMAEVAQVPGTRELNSSVGEGLPEVQIKVDRARAATYGLSPSQVAQAVQAAVKGQVVTQYRVGGQEYDIRLQATEGARRDVNALAQLPISTPGGQAVPLGDLARVTRAVGPTVVEREDQARVIRITGQIYNRDLASVIADIRARLNKLPLPPGYTIDYGGQNEQMEDAFGGLSLALAFSIVLVYLVMAAQFESFLHPFVILFTIPLSMVGAVGGLVVTGRNLDISGMIGVILLVGIVVNNAIVLIDYTNQLRRDGMARDQAVRTAGPTRLRPVLMTTLTTLLGLFPLALGLAEGSDMQAPMATVVMGGLAFSTLLTLVVIPVVYTLMDDLVVSLRRRFFPKTDAAAL
ncbi:MAG: efflux RND transporter permease subunit [Bacillota bacterium]